MQKKVPYVAQLGNMDCSIACMTMLFRYYGLDVDIVDVGQVVHIGRDGVNLTQLKQATQQFGFKCTAYRYNKQKNILDSNLPAVVYSGSHLAVIGSKTVLGQYILLDPIKGKSIVNFEQIHDTFSDILITIRPEKRIKRKECKPKLKVAINYKLVAGIISLMLLIQALTLSIPLVEQALIDSITQSQSLLNSAYILVGCIVIAGLYFFLSIARQKLMLRLDISFVKEIMTKMLKKLFDIDPSFFEWHAVGEIVNRFSNVQAINNIIINTFSQVAVQIITSTICLVTMFVYSPSLSVITIAIGTIELVLLLGINKKNREDTSKYIADQSNMQGLLAEAIGNIIEIRCMGMEKAIYKNLTNQFLDELESFRKKSNTGNQMLAISSTITLIFPLIIYIFGGESSLVYSYSLLYQLTRNPEYLKYAEKHFPIIERAVQYDQAFDVVYGNAGAILALINLYSLKRDKRYLNCAKTAAKVICDAQQKGGGWKAATVSAPLAGFSHGVAGIVYALNKLYKLYPDKHIKQCIVNGLQYEDELFCEADGNWKDIRKGSTNGKNLCAWCHGAGGILLSRISLLGNIDNETDEIVKEDIRNAVKTMQSHKYLQNPCVCHGIAGNAEILLTYGQQFQDQIASSTAKHFYSRLVGSVNSGTFECSRPYLYGFNIPGFMTGLAGIGYSLLRLLDPTLPSVLQINI